MTYPVHTYIKYFGKNLYVAENVQSQLGLSCFALGNYLIGREYTV